MEDFQRFFGELCKDAEVLPVSNLGEMAVHLRNALSDVSAEAEEQGREVLSFIRTYVPAANYLLWEESTCIPSKDYAGGSPLQRVACPKLEERTLTKWVDALACLSTPRKFEALLMLARTYSIAYGPDGDGSDDTYMTTRFGEKAYRTLCSMAQQIAQLPESPARNQIVKFIRHPFLTESQAYEPDPNAQKTLEGLAGNPE